MCESGKNCIQSLPDKFCSNRSTKTVEQHLTSHEAHNVMPWRAETRRSGRLFAQKLACPRLSPTTRLYCTCHFDCHVTQSETVNHLARISGWSAKLFSSSW